ncbi:hypothetical protein UlMin_032791 [Ulmus minor]
MEVEQVLHMNGGIGENSYSNNSSLQRLVIAKAKPILEESVVEVYCRVFPECLRIADLGCSSGPNTLAVATEIMNTIEATCNCLKQKPPSFQVFLNDLPGNDFNTIFQSLPRFYESLEKEKGGKFGPCFVTGTPGSFYGRLFPNNFVHIGHSSYSLHWLAQVPKGLVNDMGEAQNKGNIYITKNSPPVVHKAYFDQFEEDFTLFIKFRSEEIVPGGSLVITTMGSLNSQNPKNIWESIGNTLNDMVSEGLIEEEKLNNFNLPYYAPTACEVKKLIEEEGSFSVQKLDIFAMDWDAGSGYVHKYARGQYVSNYMRAVAEPILKCHFEETIMDDLFKRYADNITNSLVRDSCQHINLVISLTKKA